MFKGALCDNTRISKTKPKTKPKIKTYFYNSLQTSRLHTKYTLFQFCLRLFIITIII